MDGLPAEITAMIISHIPGDIFNQEGKWYEAKRPWLHPLAPYATISRRWQHHIEALTFGYIELTPARAASPLAAQALTPHRLRHYVHSVDVEVLLPPYSVEARGRRENEAEKAEADMVFTDLVRRVFALLSASGHGSVGHPQQHQQQQHQNFIYLSMTASCVSDTEDMESECDWNDQLRDNHIRETRYRYDGSYLDLRPAAGRSVRDEVEALPQLPWICDFSAGTSSLRSDHVRRFAPRALCLMASRFPRLCEASWVLGDNEKRDPALRERLRTGELGLFNGFLRTTPPGPRARLSALPLIHRRGPFEAPTD